MASELFQHVKEFTQEELLDTLEYLESFPEDFKVPFRMTFKRDLDKIAGNGKRVLDKRSSLIPFMKEDPRDRMQGKVDFEIVDSPNASIYQKRYCKLIKTIEEERGLSDSSKKLLIKILAVPCYMLEDFGVFERLAAEQAHLVKEKESIIFSLNYLSIVLPFKAEAYDFMYSLVHKYLYDTLDEKKQLFNKPIFGSVVSAILPCIAKKESIRYIKAKTIASLMTIYARMIGADTVFLSRGYDIQVRNIMVNRGEDPSNFLHWMQEIDKNNESLSSLIEVVNETVPLVGYVGDGDANESTFFRTDDNCGTFIFTGEDIDLFWKDAKAMEETMMDQKLYEYMDNVDPENMTFDLSVNEIGHVQDVNGESLTVTVYGPVQKEVTEGGRVYGNRIFLKFGKDVFLMFRLQTEPSIVYGISVYEDENQNRKVLRLEMNPNVTFSFVG